MSILDLFLISAFLIITYLIASIFIPMLSGGAGYTPTPRKLIDEALELVNLRKDDIFYDLGCGTGDVLIRALKRCDNVRGVEIDPLRWLISRLRAREALVTLGDLFRYDISDADVIFIFQYRGKINDRFADKILDETDPGTRVISYIHPINNMNLINKQGDLYVYET